MKQTTDHRGQRTGVLAFCEVRIASFARARIRVIGVLVAFVMTQRAVVMWWRGLDCLCEDSAVVVMWVSSNLWKRARFVRIRELYLCDDSADGWYDLTALDCLFLRGPRRSARGNFVVGFRAGTDPQ